MKQIYTPRSANRKDAKSQALKDILKENKPQIVAIKNLGYDIYSVNAKHISMSPKEFIKIYINS
jgi:hypothetical protein